MFTGVAYGSGVPATIPTHPAAVLPLKLRWPRRFDGVALVVGAMSPDFPYVVAGTWLEVPSHALHSLLWYAVPMGVLVTALVRWAAPAVAANLPDVAFLSVRDYGVLGAVRHPVVVTAYSAVLGALSHIAWDAVTHPVVIALHPAPELVVPALVGDAAPGWPWWYLIRMVSDVLGPVLVLGFAVHIGRNRLLLRWHGPAPDGPRRPVLFWTTVAVTGAAALAGVAALSQYDARVHVVGTRLIGAVTLALLAGAAVVRSAHRAADPHDHRGGPVVGELRERQPDAPR